MSRSQNKDGQTMNELPAGIKSREDILPAYFDRPSKIFIEITTRCNLKCGMCVKQNDEGGIVEGNLSPETFSALETALPYIETLVLSGIGEPLLHPGLEDFIYRAKELIPEGAWTGFQTNGLLLSEVRALSLMHAGLDRICLSLDAVSHENFRRIREGGEFRDVERAFDALNRARRESGNKHLQAGIEFVLMRNNLSELPGTLTWAARQGAAFALVTQLLPYNKTLIKESVYDTNTASAISVYNQWKARAENEGIDIRQYFDVFMKYFKSIDEEKIFSFVDKMKSDARAHDIALQIERLLLRDEEWFKKVEEVFEESRQIAREEGIDLKLPEMAPKNNRKCEFVEADSAFISWDGDVHPCYFLWHRYRCYVGGWEKQVKPWVFGNLSDMDMLEIWNSDDYRFFRKNVLQYDFPFCFDCNFALCDYVQGEDFEQDCYVRSVPCGACLWCTGLFHCLQ